MPLSLLPFTTATTGLAGSKQVHCAYVQDAEGVQLAQQAQQAQHAQQAQLTQRVHDAWAAHLANLTPEKLAVINRHTLTVAPHAQHAQHDSSDAQHDDHTAGAGSEAQTCDSSGSGVAAQAQQPGSGPKPSSPQEVGAASAEGPAAEQQRLHLQMQYEATLKLQLSQAEAAADRGPVRESSAVQAAWVRLAEASAGACYHPVRISNCFWGLRTCAVQVGTMKNPQVCESLRT